MTASNGRACALRLEGAAAQKSYAIGKRSRPMLVASVSKPYGLRRSAIFIEGVARRQCLGLSYMK